MAGKQGIAIHSAPISTGEVAKTVIQLVAAALHPIQLVEIGISFYGINNTHQPILVTLTRQADAGTSSALSITPGNDSDADSFDTTARHSASGEPAGATHLRRWTVHPQTGQVWAPNSLGIINIGGSDRLGMILTAADSINCEPYMVFVE